MSNSMPNKLPLKKAPSLRTAFYGLETTVCYLMTRFMTDPCPRIARAIVHHLQLLTEHPEAQDEAESNEVYGELLKEWQVIISELSRQSNLLGPFKESLPGKSTLWREDASVSEPENHRGIHRDD